MCALCNTRLHLTVFSLLVCLCFALRACVFLSFRKFTESVSREKLNKFFSLLKEKMYRLRPFMIISDLQTSCHTPVDIQPAHHLFNLLFISSSAALFHLSHLTSLPFLDLCPCLSLFLPSGSDKPKYRSFQKESFLIPSLPYS